MKQAPRPENTTQLRSFLEMINYHGKFIHNLSSILHPLNQLLQKNREFEWTAQCEEAFQTAKDSLTSSSVLVHYDPKLPVVLETDASPYGIAAVLFHRLPNGTLRPIAYSSRSLSKSEANYSQIEKEELAIIFGVTKSYMYLYARKFTLRTDHKPLIKIFAPDSVTPLLAAARLQRWSLLLSSYHYDIEYKNSAEVASADALSRLPLKYRKDASVEDSVYHVTSQLHNHQSQQQKSLVKPLETRHSLRPCRSLSKAVPSTPALIPTLSLNFIVVMNFLSNRIVSCGVSVLSFHPLCSHQCSLSYTVHIQVSHV